jgi:hypothetical protein
MAFLAQGYAFADNAQLRLRLELADGFDDIRVDFGALPPGEVGKPFSLTFGASVTPTPIRCLRTECVSELAPPTPNA